MRRSNAATVLAALWSADRRRTLTFLACIVLGALLPVAMMLATGAIVHSLSTGSTGSGLWAVAGFVAAAVANAAAKYGGSAAEARLSGLYIEYAEDTLSRAVLAPQTIGHLENPEIVGRIGAAAEAARENIYYWSLPALRRVLTLYLSGITSGLLLFGFTWWAAPMLFAAYGVLIWLYSRWDHADIAGVVEATVHRRRRAEYYRELLAEPAAAKEVRIFALAPWLDARFGETWLRAMWTVWRTRRAAGRPVSLGVLALIAAHVLVLAVLAHRAVLGTVSAAALTVFVQAIVGMDALARASYDGRGVARAAAELRNLHDLRRELANSEPTTSAVAIGPAEVRLDNVRFRYPGADHYVLDGLSLSIPCGQSIGIVGANGAGKSTMVKLLAGLYRPDAGAVLVDGRAADPSAGRVSAIFQSFARYELPLRENITLCRPDVDESIVDHALSLAGAADLGVSLDTTLASAYPGGRDLSGGQWQRVALARALAAVDQGAGLLILDEPTASLDIRAEVELFDRFLEVTRGVTTVLVSHRLSSVRHADRIVVLDAGRIVEDGTHEELIRSGGQYATLFSLQASRFQTHA